MSAQIVGLNGEMDAEPGKEDDLDSLLAKPASQQSQQAPSPEDKLTGDDVPEKYRDKTAAELLGNCIAVVTAVISQ